MLVRFFSSTTGELLMFADVAKALLQVIGKETTARGAFTPAEMQPAADALRQAVQHAGPPADVADEDEERPVERPVGLGPRAWPFIDMLERTGRAGPKANIIWEAPVDF
ncbi:MAG: DUF1840 domain-containing protein [Bacteroidota bacterium]